MTTCYEIHQLLTILHKSVIVDMIKMHAGLCEPDHVKNTLFTAQECNTLTLHKTGLKREQKP